MRANQVSGFFGNHDGGGVGVASGDAGHDGGVHDAERFEAVDSELRVHDGEWVVAHFAGAGGVIESLGFGADEGFEVGVSAGLRAGMQFCAGVGSEGIRVSDGAGKFDAFDDNAEIFGSAEIIGANGSGHERIGGAEGDFAVAVRSDKRGAEAEGVFGVGVEAVIAVVGGAEEELQVRDRKIRARAMEEASFGNVGSERAAMGEEITGKIGERGGVP